MSRARRGFKARRRRNRILKLAKGFTYDRRTKYRHAAQTVVRALHNAYKGRRLLKRNMRGLWIQRISAASGALGKPYSKFMGDLKAKNVTLNRKMLSEIAARDAEGFAYIFDSTK